MDTNIIRNREYLKDELRDYFYYCCRNTDPISNKLIASALGEPDYTIYSIGEFGDPLCKSREFALGFLWIGHIFATLFNLEVLKLKQNN